MKVKNISNIFKTFFLFICLLYAYIPFESQSIRFTNAVHILAQLLILLYSLYIAGFKVKINKAGKLTIYFLAIITSIAMMVKPGVNGLLFIISILFGSITASVICNNSKFKKLFVTALKWLIIFSISILFLQLSIFLITGEIIDFHKMVYPFSSIRIGLGGNFENFFRMGGIYIEPGTYSNFMFLFLVLYIFISKNISSPLLIIGAISIIMTYSLWGIVFGSFLLFVLLIINFNKYSKVIKTTMFIVLISSGIIFINTLVESVVFQYTVTKMNSDDDDSVSSKRIAYDRYMEDYDNFLIIGEGFYPKFSEGIGSVQDSGFILNFSVIFGILSSIIIIIVFVRSVLKSNSLVFLIISLPIFISKIFFYDASFWLLFFIVIFGINPHKKIFIKYVVSRTGSVSD